jgi:hypothetical protein
VSEGRTGKENSSCGLRQTQVRRSQFSWGRLATHLVSVASSPGFFVSRAAPPTSTDATSEKCRQVGLKHALRPLKHSYDDEDHDDQD